MSILDAVRPYKLGAEIVVFGALAAGAMYGVHQFLEHERGIGRTEVQARWDAQKLADKETADKQAQFWRDRYTDAVNQGAKNAQNLHTDAAAALAAANGLRSTTDKLGQLLSSAPAETARKYAAAYQAVFADCVGRYRTMGEAAQGHANDAATVGAAWPTKAVP